MIQGINTLVVLVLVLVQSLPVLSAPATYDDMTCPLTSFSKTFWDDNMAIRKPILASWIGRGIYYAVDPNTLLFTLIAYSDATLKQFYDPKSGSQITQFWTRSVSPTSPTGHGVGVGIPSGNFSSYLQSDYPPHNFCLVANNTETFERYFSKGVMYELSLETNTHYNKSTQRVAVHESFRYPEYAVPVRRW